MWISFIDEITPLTKGLMLAVAPFADETHNAFEVLEGIARISARYPEAAYELWLGVLQGSSPDFPEEAIDLALRNIAGAGPQGPRNAKNIVDHYLKSGNDRPAYLMAQSGGKAHQ